jgi:hypothetical protein
MEEDSVNPVGVLNSFNGAVVLGIAGAIAAIFIILVVVDAIFRKRLGSGRHGSKRRSAEAGLFKGILLFFQQVRQEFARRRRHRQRARDRER